MSGSVTSWLTYRFLRRQIRWSSTPISWRIFNNLLLSTQSRALAKSEAEVVFLELLGFLQHLMNVAIWSLFLLPLQNPAYTSESSQFMYCWSLAWRIFNITLLACEMNTVVVGTFFGIAFLLDWNENLTLSSPVATAEFSKFAAFEYSTLTASSIRIFK